MKNTVFIATSLDGYIAGKNNEIDWLESVPNPEQQDLGYLSHMKTIDALVMGKNTFELVLSFDIEWPYDKPVFVLSNSLESVPAELQDKVFLLSGSVAEVISAIHSQGFHNLYIDGGVTIQQFLQADAIDEMIITTIPILLGSGIPLFAELERPLMFQHVSSEQYLNAIVQNKYVRIRDSY